MSLALSVIFGPQKAARLAVGFVALAALLGTGFWYFRIIQGAFSIMTLMVIPHGVVLIRVLGKFIDSSRFNRTINQVIGVYFLDI